jgi:adenine phosphoribosyltransferase
MELKKYIRDVPDFPKKGIIFKDITPLLQNAEAFNNAIFQMYERVKDHK